MKLTDSEISAIVKAEEEAAVDYCGGELAKKRERNLNYYNCELYGDEVEGQSKAVTSDVSDVIEWMLPDLIRLFTQGKLVAKFDGITKQDEQEADEKTAASNFMFMHQNNGTLTLHNMFKDALLQYTGTVKVCWVENEDVMTTEYKGLSESEYMLLMADPEVESIEEVEVYETPEGVTYDCEGVRIKRAGTVEYYNIPPEEFLVDKNARDFVNPRFIGHRSPKRRSEIMSMGFDEDVVWSLPADTYFDVNGQKHARYKDYDNWSESNPTFHHPNDTIYLGEYYLEMDVDGDGITEYWKVIYAGDTVLEKEQVEDHPFAVAVPIPIPHRAIGSCPAEQAADIQYRKSHILRQGLDNLYLSNYPRTAHSNKVDLDDLLTPRAGGTIEVDTESGDVQGHFATVTVPNLTAGVLQALEYTDVEREIRTGITRYGQGIDAESLNKTATGFKGIMDASQQRKYLIARLFADGGVKRIFELTVKLLAQYQDDVMQVKFLGKPLEIDPRKWGDNIRCRIDVGIGSGDRQEKILNLNNVLNWQLQFMQQGLLLSDQAKIFNTMEKLIDEVGLKDADEYFNNVEIPEDTLMAQLQQATQMIQQLQMQLQSNPIAEAEQIRAQAKLIEAQVRQTTEAGKLQEQQRQFEEKMMAERSKWEQELAYKLTELEQKYNAQLNAEMKQNETDLST